MVENVIETAGLTKIYGKKKVVNEVNLHVKKGRIYGLLGRNGAGKTTIMKMILGLASISSGAIALFDQDVKSSKNSIYQRVGSIIEAPAFYSNMTGTENLELFAGLRGVTKKNAVAEILELVDLPYKDSKKYKAYSMGMKQRLGIANLLLNDPELIILDEPTNGLDPIGIAELREFIKKMSTDMGKTVLISSHILSEVALLADDIGIIHKGCLLEETSMEALHEKNQEYIHLTVNDVSKVIPILEEELNISHFQVENHHALRIYDLNTTVPMLIKMLSAFGIDILGISSECDSLEDYFKKMTGGEADDEHTAFRTEKIEA